MADLEPTPDGATERMDSEHADIPDLELEANRSMSGLTVGDIIGEGGMGVVRTAMQNSLARHVAIKTAHPGASEQTSRRMLSEAWVTGYLEHPGVVPVYDIVKGADGSPVVVMRRIDGATWDLTMGSAAWAAGAGARDLLDHNLRTMVRLCEIVEFAHSKGVVHRDIKPSNVMLGAFGEVYLLDWGLAVALTDEAAAHLPRAADVNELAGTLHYAAPEMVGLVDGSLSEHTDIYLLGALLYEITVGRPPHDAPTAARTFESIAASPPTHWPSVPPRLAAIGKRAMQKAPAERHASVPAFRREIVDYLRSRDSEHLTSGAQRALAALEEACTKGGARRKIYDLYGECRFAFREALRMWPDNEIASRGLTRASSLVIEHELTRDPRVASALLEEATNVAPALVARIRSAVAAEAEERAGLSRLAHDHDSRVGRRARRWIFVFFGLVWTASQLWGDQIGPVTHQRFALGALLQIPPLLLVWFGAPDLTRNLFNRRILLSVALTTVAQCMLFVVAYNLDVSVLATRILQIGLWAFAAGALTTLLDRRLWPMTLGLAAALVVALLRPDLRSLVAGFATLGVTINVTATWSRRR
jgi:eukaryotic-like serine/threonine-protein kinase